MKIQTYRFAKDHLLLPLKTIFFFHKRKKNHPVTPIHGDTNLFFVKNSTLFNSLCYLFISLILFICYFPGSMYMLRISLLKKLTTLGCVLFITESGTWEKLMVSLGSILLPPHCRHFCSHELETQMVQVIYPKLCTQWQPWGSSDVLDSPPSAHCWLVSGIDI